MARQDVVVTRGSTFENEANLAPTFLAADRQRYEGTRLGRQELDAELLSDNPGALWQLDWLDRDRISKAPELRRIVVAIDPAVSNNEGSDETGIIVAGVGADGKIYVLEDCSGRYAPHEWAAKAIDAYRRHKADRILAEVNNGGAMVEATIRALDPRVSFKAVHASRGKVVRAEPIAALYEQRKVHHVGGLRRPRRPDVRIHVGLRPRADRLFAGSCRRARLGTYRVERSAADLQRDGAADLTLSPAAISSASSCGK
ncbi:phage terminase large subunit family protein [Bradyrhizobium guangdongense]